MEQFYYKLDYLEGDKNILADCFSRLPRMDNKITVGKKEIDMNEKQKGTLVDFKLLKVPSNESRDDELNVIELKTTATSKDWSYDKSITTNNRDEPEIFPTMCTNDNHEMIECLLNMPSYQDEDNPLTMINIANHQLNDQQLMQQAQQLPLVFPIKTINNIGIVCKREEFPY